MTPLRHDDSRLPNELRAELLLAEMTLQEKCHQLVSVPAWWISGADDTEPAGLTELLAKGPGHVSNFGADDPAQHARLVGRIQRVAVEHTRLGIPLLFHAEALNGFLCGGHAVFPTAIGLATTWSPDLVRSMADLIRTQMVRTGVRQALSPVMDVALDPRWGRVHETYGEDPYLAAAFAVAYTQGLQGDDLTRGVIATAKHFLAYGLPQGGLNLAAVELGSRAVRDLYAFPFEAAIQVAGLRGVMNSYADLDGVAVGASREILTDLLRDTLGFDGFVSADYMTLEHIVTRQHSARTPAEAGRLTIAAGLDVENPVPYGYGDTLATEIEAGRADIADVNRSVTRVLRAKFELGLFENPYPAESIDLAAVAAEGRELSSELARRSVVLANNDGTLPLAEGVRVAVIGPHADAVGLQFPTYTFPAFREMTLFMSSGGLGNMVGVDPGMANWNSEVFPPCTTEEFVRRDQGATSLVEEVARFAGSVTSAPGCTLTSDLDPGELQRAVSLARDADVVVLALGGASLWFGGERTEGEASDTANIDLPAAQARLADAVAATGTPVVVVLVQGRAYALPPSVRDASAVLISSFGGPCGPRAVAEVVFGAVNPSGKLPYSVPLHSGQIPVFHHQKAGSGHRMGLPPGVAQHYLDMPARPLYPFGHGLSYTTFGLSGLTADAETTTDGSVQISALVSNTAQRDGAAVVQLYVRVNTMGVTRPAQQLAGFCRVELAAGAARWVTFTVDATQFAYTNLDRQFCVEPAGVDFFLGFDSDDHLLSGTFAVTGPARAVASAERTFFTEVVTHDDGSPK